MIDVSKTLNHQTRQARTHPKRVPEVHKSVLGARAAARVDDMQQRASEMLLALLVVYQHRVHKNRGLPSAAYLLHVERREAHGDGCKELGRAR